MVTRVVKLEVGTAKCACFRLRTIEFKDFAKKLYAHIKFGNYCNFM